MNATGAKILFGCSSLKISNARDAALVYKLLQYEGFVSGEFLGWPTRKFKMDGLAHWLRLFKNGLNFEETRQAEALISPLLNSYLRMGAKIAAEPAFDRDFDCIDILTVMKKEDLDRTVANKLKLV
jgi:putative hemolysin